MKKKVRWRRGGGRYEGEADGLIRRLRERKTKPKKESKHVAVITATTSGQIIHKYVTGFQHVVMASLGLSMPFFFTVFIRFIAS